MHLPVTRVIARFRSFKFAPFAVIALFLFTNLAGLIVTTVSPVVASQQVASSEIAAPVADDAIPADIPSSGDHNLDLIIFRAGDEYGVDPRLIHAVIWQESKYKTDARSHAGAKGLMQLMPATAERFGCCDVNDAQDSVEAGTRYLRWLLKRFEGDVSLALAAYNAGEGSVDKYKGIPPFGETQNYVRIITERYGKLFHPVLAPDEARLEFGLTPAAAASDSSNNAA